MSSAQIDLLHGTLDLLILRTLLRETTHGWGVALRIQQLSHDALQINQGSLYPALHRLEREGWIRAEWRASENNRRAKYYQLTPAGRRRLESQTAYWRKFAAAVELILGAA